MKTYQVKITHEAERDIEDIYNYITMNDSIDNAEYVLEKLEELILSLAEAPERGHYPEELSIQGIKDFKEVIFKPYRVIYEISASKVIIHLCVDGRRDMKSLLERRLLR